MLKDYFHLTPSQLNLYNSIISFAFIFKPAYGFISDNFLICGSRREIYLVIFGLLASIIYVNLSFFHISVLFVTSLQIIINISSGMLNSVSQAFLVEDSNISLNQENDLEKVNLNLNNSTIIENPQEEANKRTSRTNDNVSLFYFLDSFGLLSISFLSGFLTQNLGFSDVFLLCAIFPFIMSIIGFILFNKADFIKKKFKKTLVSRIRTACGYICQKEIILPIILIFIISLQPSTYDALMYFYMNDLKFDYEFIGLIQVAGSIGSIISIALFNRFCKKIKIRNLILLAIISEIMINLFQLIQIFKLDYIIFRISPKLFALFYQTIYNLTQELQNMPIFVLTCKLCPMNSEEFIYEIG